MWLARFYCWCGGTGTVPSAALSQSQFLCAQLTHSPQTQQCLVKLLFPLFLLHFQ